MQSGLAQVLLLLCYIWKAHIQHTFNSHTQLCEVVGYC